MRGLVLIGLFAACGGDDTYMIVTVDKRPAVSTPTKLEVTLSNAGSMRTDALDIGGNTFPVTFSLSAPGRAGELGISIDALDAQGTLVGRGVGKTTLGEETASVMLDSADFVVNATYANNQFLSNDFEAVGLQLGALGNGTWTVAFREDCMPTSSCSILARRFDTGGKPVRSELAAGDTQFAVSTRFATAGAIPAVASSGTRTMVAWDYVDSLDGTTGVACRMLNEQGAAASPQEQLSTDSSDVVTAAPLPNGNFVVTWQTFVSPNQVIRGAIVQPTCTKLGNVFDVSTVGGTPPAPSARRSHVTANGTTILYAWIADDAVRIRTGAFNSTLGTEVILVQKTSSQTAEHVRVAPWGTGFAVAVRWAATTTTGPGKIDVYRVSAAGAQQGAPILVTDKSGSDFASSKAFGLARRSDDALMVAWHQCDTGPGSCDVYGRILRPSGVPVGEPTVIATSTGSDQVNPSIVALDASSFAAAWTDSSGLEPDQSGSAVRARILYPAYDDARGILGAPCGASASGATCGPGLACAIGSDTVNRCFVTCTPPSCPGGGTCSTVDATTSACTF